MAALGYAYVALGVTGLGLLDGGDDARRAAAALFSLAAAAFLWFLGSLRSRLMRYDPDGFFAAIVLVGGASSVAVQVVAVALVARTGPDDILSFLSALGAPSAATVCSAVSRSSASGSPRRRTSGRSPTRTAPRGSGS